MTNYDLTFDFTYERCDNFKEKEINTLKNILSMTRIAQEIVYKCNATISFDVSDKTHEHPHITELEKYARSKTNGIIYELKHTKTNPGIYNRCLIYKNEWPKSITWGFVMFNSETGKQQHQYMIDEDFGDLIFKIQRNLTNANLRFNYGNPADDGITSHIEKIIKTV